MTEKQYTFSEGQLSRLLEGVVAEARKTPQQDTDTSLESVLQDRHLPRIYKQTPRETDSDGGLTPDEPLDTFFTTPILRIFTVPEGFYGVRKRLDRTYGLLGGFNQGRINSGLRFFIGLGGIWGEVAIVDGRLRTEDIQPQNITTKDNITLPIVDAFMNYQVIDPVKSLTGVVDYVSTIHHLAEARVRNVFTGLELDEIANLKDEKRNLATDVNEGKYKFPELEKMGLDMVGLYITDFTLPQDMQDDLAAKRKAIEAAKGELEQAKLKVEIAEQHAKAAKIYKDNPEAQMLLYRELAEEFAKSDNQTLIMPEGFLKSIASYIRPGKSE